MLGTPDKPEFLGSLYEWDQAARQCITSDFLDFIEYLLSTNDSYAGKG